MSEIKNISKFQWNALFVHILAILGLCYYWDPAYLIAFIIGNRIIMGLGQDIGMHRYFAHRSFKTRPWLEYVFMFSTWYSSQGDTIGWVALHRMHHSNSDSEKDPHPASGGLKTWLWCYTSPSSGTKLDTLLVKDLIRKPEHVFMHRHYFKFYWASLLLFTLLFGIKFVLFFFILNAIVGFHTAGLINVLCHKWGYKNFETNDNSKNLPWANWLHLGAGWHNNHHARPNSYTMQLLPNEWDGNAWIIKNILATNKDELKPMTPPTANELVKST